MKNKIRDFIKVISAKRLISFLIIGLFIFVYSRHYDLLNFHALEATSNESLSLNVFGEIYSRQFWALSSVILITSSFISIYYGFYAIKIIKNIKSKELILFFFFCLLCFFIAWCFFSNFSFSGLGNFLIKGNVNSDFKSQNDLLASNESIIIILNFSTAFSALAIFLILISLYFISPDHAKKDGSIIFLPVEDLRRRLSFYKNTVYLTTLFLAVGIIQVFLLFSWLVKFKQHNLTYSEGIVLAQNLSISGGVIYTALFLIMIIPVAIQLKDYIRVKAIHELPIKNNPAIVKSADKDSKEEKSKQKEEEIYTPEKWMKENDLYYSPRKEYLDFLIITTPAIISVGVKIFELL